MISGIGRHEGVEARERGERDDRQRIGPRLRLQLDRIEPDRDDEVGLGHEVALDQPADDAAGAQRMVLRDHALALRRGEHRRAEPFGELHELRRRLAPENAEAGEQDRPPRARQGMSSAGLRSARSGPGITRFATSGGSAT